jgi:hypothetical protein
MLPGASDSFKSTRCVPCTSPAGEQMVLLRLHAGLELLSSMCIRATIGQNAVDARLLSMPTSKSKQLNALAAEKQ